VVRRVSVTEPALAAVSGRAELLDALLSANDANDATDAQHIATLPSQVSTPLAASYVPVVLAGAGVTGRIQALLDNAPAGSICGSRGDHVLLLIPDELEHASAETLRRVSAGIVAYGPPARPGENLRTAVQQAEQLCELASSEYGGTGIYGPEDLLVEQLMLAAPRLTRALRRRVSDALDARDPSGVLTATLRTYLSCGSVPETARLELVHPNTVGYRLSRVRDLLGLDPRVPTQAALLVLGLGVRTAADVPPYPDAVTAPSPRTARK
jgi:hypothetical protein